jgi:probable rRNA maturation factor
MRPLRRGLHAAPLVEVLVASARWRKKPKAALVVRQAIRTAAKFAIKSASTTRSELAILLTDDSAIRALNHNWRKRNAPTNVLSFPARPMRGKLPLHLGDIVIAFETVAREAKAEEKSFDHHLAHLAVHGYLHLLGYDHASNRDAEEMESLEASVLARLGMPNPYNARSQSV